MDPGVGVINPFEGIGPPPTGVKDPGVILAVLIWGVFLGVLATCGGVGGIYFIGYCTGGIALGTLGLAADIEGIPADTPGFTEGVNTCAFSALSCSGFTLGSKGLECP